MKQFWSKFSIQAASLASIKLSPWPLCLQEDMNLNEERKAPLREKDLSTKREMVVQYISATAKSVSEPVQILQCCVCEEAVARLLNESPPHPPPVLCSAASCSAVSRCTRLLLTLSHSLCSPCSIPTLLIAILILSPSHFQLRLHQADLNHHHSLTQCKVDGQCLPSCAHAWRWLVCLRWLVFLVAGDAALFVKKKKTKLKDLGEDKANMAKFNR